MDDNRNDDTMETLTDKDRLNALSASSKSLSSVKIDLSNLPTSASLRKYSRISMWDKLFANISTLFVKITYHFYFRFLSIAKIRK